MSPKRGEAKPPVERNLNIVEADLRVEILGLQNQIEAFEKKFTVMSSLIEGYVENAAELSDIANKIPKYPAEIADGVTPSKVYLAVVQGVFADLLSKPNFGALMSDPANKEYYLNAGLELAEEAMLMSVYRFNAPQNPVPSEPQIV